ncbi:MAG: hypothetical protein IH597_02470 [Bacteroidales bacterium]|nr:hypothetical protein [Bacteroidales bacterium]
MNYHYKLNDPFLGIRFNFTPSQVKVVLGEPDSVEKHYYSETNKGEYDEILYYEKGILRIIFSYENFAFSDLSIFTECMFINEVDIFSLSKREVLAQILKISRLSSNEAFIETVNINEVDCDSYEFKDIGLTLWFEFDSLDEICLFNTDELNY